MPTTSDRTIRAALIPWIFALMALVGLNAITPDFSRGRKNDSPGESGLSQLADNPAAPGHLSNPLVFLVPHATCRAAILVSRVLRIEVFCDEPPFQSPQGSVHGRAPPAGWAA